MASQILKLRFLPKSQFCIFCVFCIFSEHFLFQWTNVPLVMACHPVVRDFVGVFQVYRGFPRTDMCLIAAAHLSQQWRHVWTWVTVVPMNLKSRPKGIGFCIRLTWSLSALYFEEHIEHEEIHHFQSVCCESFLLTHRQSVTNNERVWVPVVWLKGWSKLNDVNTYWMGLSVSFRQLCSPQDEILQLWWPCV